MHWHSAPHQLALHVLWDELSSNSFSSRKSPGFEKESKRRGGLYNQGVQLYLVNTEEGRKHFYDSKYSEVVYTQQTLHPDLHHSTTFSPVLTGLTKTSPFSSLRGSAVAAIAALALQRAPWERYQGTEDCKRLCFSCTQCCRSC